MLKLDNNLLQEIGLGSLPEDQKRSMLQHIYETLELRVGTNLANQMTDQQLEEFEKFIDEGGDANQAQALQWLETNLPNYKQVVNEVFEQLKVEIKQMAPQIVASSQAQPQVGAPQPQPAAPQAPAAPQQPGYGGFQQPAPQQQPAYQQPPAPQPPQPGYGYAQPPQGQTQQPMQPQAPTNGYQPAPQAQGFQPAPQGYQPQPMPQPQGQPYPPLASTDQSGQAPTQ